MSSNHTTPEDDKTRIGMGINFSPEPDLPHPGEPVFHNGDEDKTRIGPVPDVVPEPPPINAGRQESTPRPAFADDRTQIGNGVRMATGPAFPAPPAFTSSEEDLLFEAELPGGTRGFPLSTGTRITVGRESSQDIAIEDKTLSRQHLLLERQGDNVTIHVLGLNGLVHNEITYKSTTIDLAAPASFTVGKVQCRLRKKVDTDATLFMADPAQFAGNGQGSAVASGGRPAGTPPFHPQAPQGNFPSRQDQAPPLQPPPSSQPFSDDFSGKDIGPASFSKSTQGNDFENFDGQSSWEDPFAQGSPSGGKTGLSGGRSGNYTLYIIIAAVVLAGIVLCVFLFTGDKDSTVQQPKLQQPAPVHESSRTMTPPPLQAPSAAVPAATPAPAPDTTNYNLHGRFFNEAYRYYNENNFIMACDYLKDIPPTSAFRDQAENLANQMGNCDLND